MTQTFEAIFDGAVLRPDAALDIKPNTRVRVTVEDLPPARTAAPLSFLDVGREAKLSGPPDWSTNVDKYLYGDLD